MTRSILIAAALALSTTATAAYAADSEAMFDKILAISGAPTVSLATGAGYIHVTSGQDNQVHIIGHVHARPGWLSPNTDDARVKQIVASPPIVQSGNTITVGPSHADSDLYHNISIDYEVTAPRSTALTARTGSGGVEVAGIQGTVSAETGSGPLVLALSGSVDVKAQTGSGSIRIDGATGSVRAGTGSGSIHIDGVAGSLHAGTGSGSLEVAGNPTADWQLNTGSGSIHLKLANNARFTLNAGTGSGTVRVDQPILMQGSLNSHHVSGTVNGGGPAIRANTGSGDIVINGTSTVGQLHDNNSLHVPGATDCVDSPTQPPCHKD